MLNANKEAGGIINLGQKCFTVFPSLGSRFGFLLQLGIGQSLLAQSNNTPLLPPQSFCITIVCNFSWDMKMSPEKLKTMPMQIFFLEGRGGEGRGEG